MDESRCSGRKLYLPVSYHRRSHLTNLTCRHTFHQFQKQGYEAKPVDLQVSFGKGDKVSSLSKSCSQADAQVLDQPFPDQACGRSSEGYQAIRNRDQMDEEAGSCLCVNPDQDLVEDVGIE